MFAHTAQSRIFYKNKAGYTIELSRAIKQDSGAVLFKKDKSNVVTNGRTDRRSGF